MTKGNQLLSNVRSVFAYLQNDLSIDVSKGLCVGSDDPDLWFAGEADRDDNEKWTNNKEQKARANAEVDKAISALMVCRNCPAKDNCLELGMRGTPQIHFGIYGGTMPGERIVMLGKTTKNKYNENKVNFARKVRKTMRERGISG
jgi:hypothetical protein